MNTIKQAREVSSRIWNAGYVDESATIDALIAELAALKGQEPVGTVVDPTYVDMAEQLPYGTKLYLAAGAQVRAQPVQQESVDVIATMNVIRSNLESYAAPVQAQERKPLTDEQIKAVINALPTGFYGDPAILLARAIEAAHGIKKQP